MSLLDRLNAEGRDQKAQGLPAQQFDRAPARITMARAQEKRDRALQAVDAHADDGWKDRALEAIRVTALSMPDFISDDVWAVGGLDSAHEDRALGPVFIRAAKAGYITKTDRVRPSKRSNLSGKSVWKSELYVRERAA